ncbi:MAG: hypothetical protein DWQ09_01475 [Proteobacteria bacterium]|nr:MAG: hypothetical protein DWQ09_01475 [Pseudomonadota bacterium]QKK12160.1 MAG: hypothetical protein HND59_11815 [Pseudomonadota bacterium]
MKEQISVKVSELVDMGWRPCAATETTASLTTRGPFNWWLFVIILLLFPVVGGLLYLAFWLATSRVTIFVFEKDGEIQTSGDSWMVRLQMARREAFVQEQRQIKEQGFWKVMWPKVLLMAIMIGLWVLLLVWIF